MYADVSKIFQISNANPFCIFAGGIRIFMIAIFFIFRYNGKDIGADRPQKEDKKKKINSSIRNMYVDRSNADRMRQRSRRQQRFIRYGRKCTDYAGR